MILTPWILARIAAICLLGVLLQLSFFSQVELFHVSPDILPALVVCLGLLGGSLTGAVCGFALQLNFFGRGVKIACSKTLPDP